MKRVKDILRSPRFMREVSHLLFVLAVLSGLLALLLFTSAQGNLEVLSFAIASLLQGILQAAFCIYDSPGFNYSAVGFWRIFCVGQFAYPNSAHWFGNRWRTHGSSTPYWDSGSLCSARAKV